MSAAELMIRDPDDLPEEDGPLGYMQKALAALTLDTTADDALSEGGVMSPPPPPQQQQQQLLPPLSAAVPAASLAAMGDDSDEDDAELKETLEAIKRNRQRYETKLSDPVGGDADDDPDVRAALDAIDREHQRRVGAAAPPAGEDLAGIKDVWNKIRGKGDKEKERLKREDAAAKSANKAKRDAAKAEYARAEAERAQAAKAAKAARKNMKSNLADLPPLEPLKRSNNNSLSTHVNRALKSGALLSESAAAKAARKDMKSNLADLPPLEPLKQNSSSNSLSSHMGRALKSDALLSESTAAKAATQHQLASNLPKLVPLSGNSSSSSSSGSAGIKALAATADNAVRPSPVELALKQVVKALSEVRTQGASLASLRASPLVLAKGASEAAVTMAAALGEFRARTAELLPSLAQQPQLHARLGELQKAATETQLSDELKRNVVNALSGAAEMLQQGGYDTKALVTLGRRAGKTLYGVTPLAHKEATLALLHSALALVQDAATEHKAPQDTQMRIAKLVESQPKQFASVIHTWFV